MIDRAKKPKKNPQALYPWDRWLARKHRFRLTRGKDFHVLPHAMAQQIRNAAAKRDKRVSISVEENALMVKVHHQYEADSYDERQRAG